MLFSVLSNYFEDGSPELLDMQKVTKISNSRPNPPKMHLQNVHLTTQISIYLLKVPEDASPE